MIRRVAIKVIKYFRLKILSRKKNISFGKNCHIGWNSTFEGMNKISDRVTFGESHIGYASYVGYDSQILNTSIGRYTSIAFGVKTIIDTHPSKAFVSTHPCFYSLLKQSGFTYVDKQIFEEIKYLENENKLSIFIGNDVWIGADVIIMGGVRIGDGAIIASGAAVTKDVEPYAIYGGVPARNIRFRFNSDEIRFLNGLKWWDKEEKWIKEKAHLFNDVSKLMLDLL